MTTVNTIMCVIGWAACVGFVLWLLKRGGIALLMWLSERSG